tara:strand:- start:133 stop:504 length:372 start_codon:yes stop_codon:yes gene_type:complete
MKNKLKEGGTFRLSHRSDLKWDGSRIFILSGNKRVPLDKKELKNLLRGIRMHRLAELKEKASNKIQVQGIGVYTYDTLKRDVQKKVKDLAKHAKRGDWRKVSRNGIRAFAEMWDALYNYEENN